MDYKQEGEIEIQEPAVKEFEKKRSCLGKSCMSSCGCLILFIIGGLIGLQLIAQPQKTKIASLPSHISESIPLPVSQNPEDVIYIAGSEKGKSLERLAYIPKILTSPLALFIENKEFKNLGSLDRIKEYIKTPITNNPDTFTIIWTNSTISVDTIYDEFKRNLENENFTTKSSKYSPYNRELHFSSKDAIIEGTMTIEDRPNTVETERTTLTITIKP